MRRSGARCAAAVGLAAFVAGCASATRTVVATSVVVRHEIPRASPAGPQTTISRLARQPIGHARRHERLHHSLPLAGRVVGIDPGHNGRNFTDPGYIDHLIWNGRERETCNTTGTETDGGYTEARFNFDVATALTADLRHLGARVVLTRHTNDGVGPCVNERAAIINRAHADVAIDIHADGGPPGGRGFAILEPVADGPNDRIIGASERFGRDVRSDYEQITGIPISTYDGTNGISFRDDLAGLNLTDVPEVLIESGNMRNATDAAQLIQPRVQRLAARALTQAIEQFLRP